LNTAGAQRTESSTESREEELERAEEVQLNIKLILLSSGN
jgi:hypothetical protein